MMMRRRVRPHPLYRVPRAIDVAVEIARQFVAPFIVTAVSDGTRGDGSVIDQNIDATEFLDGRCNHSAWRFFPGQISGYREGLSTETRDRFQRCLRRARISMTSHVGAGFRESDRDRLAKAGRGAVSPVCKHGMNGRNT